MSCVKKFNTEEAPEKSPLANNALASEIFKWHSNSNFLFVISTAKSIDWS